jgi:hypothetical protein
MMQESIFGFAHAASGQDLMALIAQLPRNSSNEHLIVVNNENNAHELVLPNFVSLNTSPFGEAMTNGMASCCKSS